MKVLIPCLGDFSICSTVQTVGSGPSASIRLERLEAKKISMEEGIRWLLKKREGVFFDTCGSLARHKLVAGIKFETGEKHVRWSHGV